jgi:hypothetical protein
MSSTLFLTLPSSYICGRYYVIVVFGQGTDPFTLGSGSVLPWNQFGNWWGITPWRLVVLGILVMLVRRVPWVIAMVSPLALFEPWNDP